MYILVLNKKSIYRQGENLGICRDQNLCESIVNVISRVHVTIC